MYTAYFGLRENPFNITPDPRFLYANPCYREAYAGLRRGIVERRGLIVLTGEVGTGKTTLLRKLVHIIQPHLPFAFFPTPTLTFKEILGAMCQEFGLAAGQGGRLEKIQALNEFLSAQLQIGGTGVLLIDEAQNLSSEVLEGLRLLSNLETTKEKLLQIVLVGQPEFARKLDHPQTCQLKQRIAIQCQLDRLQDWEVGLFIQHRLCVAGAERQDLFTPQAVQRIALYATGIPRLINVLCDNALMLAYSASEKTVSDEIVDEVAQDLQLKRAIGFPDSAADTSYITHVCTEEEGAGTALALYPSRAGPPDWVGIVFALLLFSSGGVAFYLLQTQAFSSLEGPQPADPRKLRSAPPAAFNDENPPALMGLSNEPVEQKRPPSPSSSKFPLHAGVPSEEQRSAPTHTEPNPQGGVQRNVKEEQRMTRLLTRARRQVAAQRLTTPAGDNALETYQQVVRTARPPYKDEALRGIEAITEQYRQWAQEAQDRKQWAKAQTYYERALTINAALVASLLQTPEKSNGEKRTSKPTAEGEKHLKTLDSRKETDEPKPEKALLNTGEIRDQASKLASTAGPSSQAKPQGGWTPLMKAAIDGRIDIVQALLDKKVDVNAKNTHGMTALMYAAWNGHTAVVQALLDKGADVNVKDRKGRNALHYAQDRLVGFTGRNTHADIETLLKRAGARQ